MTAKNILVPAKFTMIMLQLILTSVIYQSKYENLINYVHNSNADQSIQAGITLCIIFLSISLIILFTGFTCDFEKTMLIQIILHGLGVVIVAWFILDSWKYDLIWMIFSLFCLLPLLLEIFPLISALYLQKAVVRKKI